MKNSELARLVLAEIVCERAAVAVGLWKKGLLIEPDEQNRIMKRLDNKLAAWEFAKYGNPKEAEGSNEPT